MTIRLEGVPTDSAEISQSPGEIRDSVVEIVQNAREQIRKLRRVGTLPMPGKRRLPGLSITPDMSLDERLRIVHENGAIYEKAAEIIGHQNLSMYGPHWLVLEGEEGEQKYRAVCWLVTPKLAILERYPMDKTNNPIGIEPCLLVSEDAVKETIRTCDVIDDNWS